MSVHQMRSMVAACWSYPLTVTNERSASERQRASESVKRESEVSTHQARSIVTSAALYSA